MTDAARKELLHTRQISTHENSIHSAIQ